MAIHLIQLLEQLLLLNQDFFMVMKFSLCAVSSDQFCLLPQQQPIGLMITQLSAKSFLLSLNYLPITYSLLCQQSQPPLNARVCACTQTHRENSKCIQGYHNVMNHASTLQKSIRYFHLEAESQYHKFLFIILRTCLLEQRKLCYATSQCGTICHIQFHCQNCSVRAIWCRSVSMASFINVIQKVQSQHTGDQRRDMGYVLIAL